MENFKEIPKIQFEKNIEMQNHRAREWEHWRNWKSHGNTPKFPLK